MSVEDLAASLPRRVGLAARLLRRYAARAAAFPVSPAAGSVLVTLSGGQRRITELAEIEGQAQPYVTKLVSELESRGWVIRARDEADGRVVWVRITDAGCDAVLHLRSGLSRVLTARFGSLSDAQLGQLAMANEALELLIETLREPVDR